MCFFVSLTYNIWTLRPCALTKQDALMGGQEVRADELHGNNDDDEDEDEVKHYTVPIVDKWFLIVDLAFVVSNVDLIQYMNNTEDPLPMVLTHKELPTVENQGSRCLSDRTKVTGGQFKEIQVSSKSSMVVTLEKVREQLVPGIYGYDIAVDEAVMEIGAVWHPSM